MEKEQNSNSEILSGYQFVPLQNLALWRERIGAFAAEHDLKGTVLLAAEGINFSLSGPAANLDGWLDWIDERLGCAAPVINRQTVDAPPFLRLKVRIRDEIVTFDPAVVPTPESTGEALSPMQWNALLESDDLQLVDTRNDYEYRIGSFAGAVNPHTESFTEFKDYCREQLDPAKPVAMFCTGGVRCEKASTWLKASGFSRVYQLHGGILGYLSATPPEASRWRGECFVFDDRVSVDASLRPTANAGFAARSSTRRAWAVCVNDPGRSPWRASAATSISVPGLSPEHAKRDRSRLASRTTARDLGIPRRLSAGAVGQRGRRRYLRCVAGALDPAGRGHERDTKVAR